MGYRNNNTGYTSSPLGTRSIVNKGNFALLCPDGLVKNTIPGFDDCDVTILSSPKLGASFVDYLVNAAEGSQNLAGFGGEGVETFLYLLKGKLNAAAGQQAFALEAGGYLFCPPTEKLYWKAEEPCEFFLYKRRYSPAAAPLPQTVCGNISALVPTPYENMEDVLLYDLLPKTLEYDMNFHILSFRPGASHGYIETHVQEHGALMLSGEGMYRLGDIWTPVQKGDYIFMGAYCPQAAYATGRKEIFSYLYSKDCNRDEPI
ncbi:MAG: (S)-ureidoglycine aminohydrolase [Oscillospiraceae bacterium]